MKKKLLVVLVAAVMGLQLVGCGGSSEAANKDSSDNKAVTEEHKDKEKDDVVDNDSLSSDVSEVYLGLKEEYLEVLENKQMKEWDEEKSKALKDLTEIKDMTPKDDNTINDAITDIEQLIEKYQSSLDGSGADPTAIQNLESEIEQLLFNK